MNTKLSVIGSALLMSIVALPVACSSSSSGGSEATAGASGSPGEGGSTANGGTSATGGTTANAGTAGTSNAGAAGTGAGGTATAGAGGTSSGAGHSAAGTGGTPAGAGGASGGSSAGTGGTPSGGNTNGGSGGSSAGTGGTGPSAGNGGTGGSSTTTAFFCPETNAQNPVNANTVLITDPLLTADAHWTADKTYLISVPEGFGSGLDVSGFTLTVDAGTVICLDSGNHLGVGTQGAGEVHINGTSANPVVITALYDSGSSTPAPSFHDGVRIDQFQASTISNLNIWYGGLGGGAGGWALRIEDTAAGTNAATGIDLDHVTIDQMQVRGLYVGSPTGIGTTSSVHIGGFVPFDPSGPDLDAIAQVDFLGAATLGSTVTIDPGAPAAVAHIDLRTASGVVDGPADLYDLGYAYHYHDVLSVAGPGATLTIHEGVTFGLDELLTIGDTGSDMQGNLVVAGTAAKPVILTSSSATPAAGDWGGIFFSYGEYSSTISKIDNAQILYAGFSDMPDIEVSYCATPTVGSIMIDGPVDGSTYASLPITNTLIAHTGVDGIVAGADLQGGHDTVDYTAVATITFNDVAGAHVAEAACQLAFRARTEAWRADSVSLLLPKPTPLLDREAFGPVSGVSFLSHRAVRKKVIPIRTIE